MKYVIRYKEIQHGNAFIEADSREQAEEMAMDLYNDGKVHWVSSTVAEHTAELDMLLFYVEFDNGDMNCYRGERVPTLEEAKIFCKPHIDASNDWNDIVSVGSISRERAEGLWDLHKMDSEIEEGK